MANSAKETQKRAEESFKKKEQRVLEGAKAVAEYEAAGLAVRAKTMRLKAIRLAKEAAMVEAEVEKKPVLKERSPRPDRMKFR